MFAERLSQFDQAVMKFSRRAARTVTTASCRTLRLCVAGLCKFAILLCLLEPNVEGLSKAAEADSFAQELTHESGHTRSTRARTTTPTSTLSEHSRPASFVGETVCSGNVLARSSGHVLANGLRAPMTC